MLTPANIKNHQFQNLGRGFYKTDEVDGYIDEIYSSYNLVYNENKELIRKLNILASKIEEYRNDEQSIRNAIINAQRMASKLIDEARKEAESIIEAAETKAESADSITNVRIKKRIDEVEALIKDTFDKARAQAKRATDKAEADAKAVITDAKIKASEIIETAAKNSRNQLATIAEDINSQQSVLSRLKEESETFKNSMIKRYEDQIYLIRSISDFAISEIDESIPDDHPDSEITKSKVDEIIESIFNEKLSSYDDFSSLNDDEDVQSEIYDSDMVFEDVYSSSDHSVAKSGVVEMEDTSDIPDNIGFDSFDDDSFEDLFSNDDSGSFDDDLTFETVEKSVPKAETFDFDNGSDDDLSDIIEEFSVDEFDENEFVFDENESVGESNRPDSASLNSKSQDLDDEKSDRDKPFTINIEDNNSLYNTFEFDFVDDDE